VGTSSLHVSGFGVSFEAFSQVGQNAHPLVPLSVLPVLSTCDMNSHQQWQGNTIVTQVLTGTGQEHWLCSATDPGSTTHDHHLMECGL
jgi:hypothetical protein